MSTFVERVAKGPGELGSSSKLDLVEHPIEIVTLLHGGGPVASEGDHPQTPTRLPDSLTVIRGSAVRGHLRFWWRATHGVKFDTVLDLRKAEDALWGNASTPGQVNLSIEQAALRTESVKTESLGGVGQGLRYGAFASSNVTRVKGLATLKLWLQAEHKTEVLEAVQAWSLFGGIGGRTRRGFGAVSSDAVPLSARAFLDGLGRTGGPATRLPALRGASMVLSKASFPTAEEAHKHAVDALRRFRQEPGFARNKGDGNRPGRSRWPEPDSIRRVKRSNAPLHEPTHPVNAFPRAAFGLPIVFHFEDRGDPGATLTARGGGRMASPLIVRPTRVNGRWYAMALRLVVSPCDEAFLGERPVDVKLSSGDASHIEPLHAHGDNPDVLAAFLDYFQTR